MHILSKKNILVTGGCGLIGSAVVELLLRNYDDTNVYVLSRREENVKKRFGFTLLAKACTERVLSVLYFFYYYKEVV